MDIEKYIDDAADYLEAAGIPYSPAMDEWLEQCMKRNIKPQLVVAEYRNNPPARA
ncbi:TPA: hypothetical protein QDB04_000138 [Burkholderia vietnamiensis]|nr:hypothetical protein [Burkholderia vietnamiensis]